MSRHVQPAILMENYSQIVNDNESKIGSVKTSLPSDILKSKTSYFPQDTIGRRATMAIIDRSSGFVIDDLGEELNELLSEDT